LVEVTRFRTITKSQAFGEQALMPIGSTKQKRGDKHPFCLVEVTRFRTCDFYVPNRKSLVK
jgi:hypothetical protein